jgi:signal transduction histidine kinase
MSSDSLQRLAAECASALRSYLAKPDEAGLMHAYTLGRRALTMQVGVAELGAAHQDALAATLPAAGSPEEQTRLTQRAAEFLGETLAPFGMVAGGYREANSHLQHCSETLAELRQASRRKDDFLAMLAHELRNPLVPIRNAVHLLRRSRPDTVDVGQVSDVMERQVEHLAELIDGLMDISRITRGKIELRKSRVDLAIIMRRAVEISRPNIEAAEQALSVVLPSEPVMLDADATRLVQVVTNLLNNASKYTEAGGCIELIATRNGSEAVLSVRDTGVGIPSEMLAHIFELFVQVPGAVDRAQGGLGIGLALVKSLVELHGGRVEADSAGPRQGSEFRVRLPLAAHDPSPPLAPALGDRGRA